jgi:drug/metabolite transporter (DMT)-like permease
MWVQALRLSSTVRVSLFSTLAPVMLLAYMRIVKKTLLSWGEYGGVGLATLGVAVSLGHSSWDVGTGDNPLVGDLMYVSPDSLLLRLMLFSRRGVLVLKPN